MIGKLIGKKNGSVGVGGFIEIEVRDKDGRVIDRAREPMRHGGASLGY
jgi:adenylate cyclase class IV